MVTDPMNRAGFSTMMRCDCARTMASLRSVRRAADIDAQPADRQDVLGIDVSGTWRAKHSPALLRDPLRWCRMRLPPINRTFPCTRTRR